MSNTKTLVFQVSNNLRDAMRRAMERSGKIARATVEASRRQYENVYGKAGDRRRAPR